MTDEQWVAQNPQVLMCRTPVGAGYTEQFYLDKANALFAISGEIQEIARSGSLP